MGALCRKTGGSSYTGRRRTKDGKCDPGKYLPCAKYCSRYPCKAYFQEAGPYKRNRAGKDRSGPYEGAARRSLDPLEYPYHHTGTDHLYSQKTGLRELFLKQWCPACEVPAVFKETEKID